MNKDKLNYDLKTKAPLAWGRKGKIYIAIAIIALIILFFLSPDKQQFKFSYITSFVFFLSISLGGLIFVLLQHIFRSGWSVIPRRIAEIFMKTLPFMAILFIPILLFINDLFAWTDREDKREKKEVIQNIKPQFSGGKIKVSKKIDEKWAHHLEHVLHVKAPYLNHTFFIIRAILYFLIWGFLAHFFFKKSTDEKRKANENTKLMSRFSAPSIILFALTVTFASFDWIMSLDYAWFSTIFGVIYFATCMITLLSATILTGIILQAQGFLKTLSIEHYHDLGKILYVFMIFFTYVAFSQLLLIWYADISEETYWYVNRWKYGWDYISLIILLGHFVLPFTLFMSRHIKRNKVTLTFMALWMLAISYIHLYWEILPNKTFPEPASFSLSWIDFIIPFTMLLFYLGAFLICIKGQFFIPIKDPRLEESIYFENY